MTTDERYNGWANRETWAVALWVNNDEGWQDSVYTLVRDLVDQHEREQYDGCTDCRQGDHSQDCATDLDSVESISPDFVGEQIRENVETLLSGDEYDNHAEALKIASDIGSLWRVDWRDIGATFLTDATS